MTAGPHESKRTTHLPRPALSRQCQCELAMLVANLIETHLGIEASSGTTLEAEAPKSDSSTNCFKPDQTSIKEDCHEHHRPTFA